MEKYKNMNRNAGIELLRIIAMGMVLMLHVLGQGGILPAEGMGTSTFHLVWALELSSLCAVNCFALISGYVGISSKYRFSRGIDLWLQVLFYSIGSTCFFLIICPQLVTKDIIVKSVFPVVTGQYWFITAYFCLFFLIPFLNKIINSSKPKDLYILCAILIMFFSVTPTLSGIDVFKAQWGYSTLWLVAIYLIGASIKKLSINVNKWMALLAYFLCVFTCYAIKMSMIYYSPDIEGIFNPISHSISYSAPLTLGASISLLLFFKAVNIKIELLQRIIIIVGKASLAVYLAHGSTVFFRKILKNHFTYLADAELFEVLVTTFSCFISIYILSILIELLRTKLFSLLKIRKITSKIDKYIYISNEKQVE